MELKEIEMKVETNEVKIRKIKKTIQISLQKIRLQWGEKKGLRFFLNFVIIF